MVITNNRIVVNLIELAVQGNFKYICQTIESDKLVLEQDDVVKIIIACCRFICTVQGATVEKSDLCDVLVTCARFISGHEGEWCKPYLQALYHITAFLVEKGSFKYIIQLEDILIPAFIKSLKSEALLEIYTSLCWIVCKSIEKLKTTEPEKCLMKTYLISLKMFAQCSNSVKLLNVASSYFHDQTFTEADTDMQCACYSYLWTTVSHTKEIYISGYSDIYKAIVETLQRMLVNLFRKREFEAATRFLEASLTALSQHCIDDTYTDLKNIISGCFPIIHEPEGINAKELISSLQACIIDLKHISVLYKGLPQLQTTCNFIFGIYQELMQYCKLLDSEMCSLFIYEEIHLELSKLFDLIAEILVNIKTDCRSCSNCNVKTGLLMSVNAHLVMASFSKLSIDKEAVLSNARFSLICKAMSRCCSRIVQLKTLHCEQWKPSWLRARVTIFNSVIKLYQLNSTKCIPYGVLLINCAIKLEHAYKLLIEPDVLCKTLFCLSQKMFKDGKPEIAAVFAALELFYCDNIENVSFSQWLKIKFHGKDDLRQLTVLCALTQKTDIIKTYFRNLKIEISNKKKVQILLRELDQYMQKWPSRTPMGAVIIKLYDIADSFTLAKSVIQIWHEYPLENDVAKLIPNIIEKLVSEESTIENNICLALLHIINYYSTLEELQVRIEESMKKTVTPPRAAVNNSSEMPKSTSDQCHLSSYVDLNLDQYFKTSTNLQVAIQLVRDCISDSALTNINDYRLYSTFEKVAYEFEKHGDSLQALQAWLVCLQLAKVIDNKLYILKSSSFILKYSNMDSEVIISILNDCNNLVLCLIPSSESAVLEVVCQYFVNKCLMFLRHQLIKEGIKEYEQLIQLYKQIPDDTKDAVLKIQLDFLTAQYMLLPCDVALENHENYSLAKLFSTLKSITIYVKCHGEARAIALLLEVNEYLVKMYKWMRFSREIRCYGRSILTFAQKQFLPLRIANTITYLAHADIISLRFDDAKAKLCCLVEVLNLEEFGKCLGDNRTALLELVDNFSKIHLTHNAIGSPGLLKKPVFPQFLCHKSGCICSYCVSFEYKSLVLVYFTLEAHLHVYIRNNAYAKACFERALQFYKHVSASKNEIKTKVTEQFLSDVEDFLLPVYGSLLLQYGNELVRTGDLAKAERLNTNLINTVTKQKRTNAYLYNESLTQAIRILLASSEAESHTKRLNLVPVSKDTNATFKTPENTRIQSGINPCSSLKPKAPPERHVRKLKFNLSPSETPEPSKPALFASKLVMKTPLKCEIRDEPFQEIQTCMKYTKRTKIKETVLKDIVNPDNSKNEVVVPLSPNAYTPNALKVRTALKARTKLLSKKVQKSSVKIHDDEIENICSTNVRKNLLKELADPEPSTENNQCQNTVTQARKVKVVASSRIVTRNRNIKR